MTYKQFYDAVSASIKRKASAAVVMELATVLIPLVEEDQQPKPSKPDDLKELLEKMEELAKKPPTFIPPPIPVIDRDPYGEPSLVPYHTMCACNPANGGSGICGCVIGNKMVPNPALNLPRTITWVDGTGQAGEMTVTADGTITTSGLKVSSAQTDQIDYHGLKSQAHEATQQRMEKAKEEGLKFEHDLQEATRQIVRGMWDKTPR